MGREMGCNKSCKAECTDNQLRQQVGHGSKVVATSQKLLHSTPLGQSKDPRLTPLTCTLICDAFSLEFVCPSFPG